MGSSFVRRPGLAGLTALLIVASTSGCSCLGGAKEPGSTKTLSGNLVTADGAPAQDFVVTGGLESGGTGTTVGSDGAFTLEVGSTRTSVLMAVPRESSSTAVRYGQGKGLYLSPVFGSKHLVQAGGGKLGLDSQDGPALLDSQTSVLAILMFHPMLANPDPDASQQVAAWLVQRANQGWPELETATATFESAVGTAVDLSGSELTAAMQALFSSLAQNLPDSLVQRTTDSSSQELTALQMTLASDGASQVTAEEDDAETHTLKLDVARGTNLDYLCVVRPASSGDFPAGKDSPRFLSPDRLSAVSTNAPIRSVFLAAKSYLSYLDVVGLTIGAVSDTIGGATVGPNTGIPIPLGLVTEVRCFSGGYGGDSDAAVFDFIQANYRADARSAFVHNVTAAAIEVFSAIPGADQAAQTDIGKEVLKKVVQQSVLEVEAKANSQGSRLNAADVYEIIYNVSKAALNEFADKASESWREGKLTRLKDFFKWGGKGLVKFINITGKLANAGAAGSRAYAMASPQSLLEYFLVSVDDPTAAPDAGGSFLSEDMKTYQAACHRLLDLECITSSLGCPDSSPTNAEHEHHDCAMAAFKCLIAANDCAEASNCEFAVSYGEWDSVCP